MAFIDDTYFFAELNLANTGNTVVASKLSYFIDKYESYYLDMLLGKTLASEFKTGYASDPTVPKWLNLKNQLIRVGSVSTNKYSPIANYVYYWFKDDAETITVASGTAKGKSENSSAVSGVDKMVRAWNEMVKLNREIYTWTSEQVDGSGNKIYTTLQEKPWSDNPYWGDCEKESIFIIKNSLGF